MQDYMANELSLNLFSNQELSTKPILDVITMAGGKPLPDGEVIIYRSFFNGLESNQLFKKLFDSINWRQDKMKIFGKEVDLPRLTAWYGDGGKSYTYSGITMNPDAWTPILLLIKERIEEVAQEKFNSVLINLYRNGKDYVSWHSDDEPELGRNPIIASVSFGQTRRFQFKHKLNKDLEKVEITLTDGSLLLMKGSTQHFWHHQIPKTSKQLKERINLTFRVIKQ
jgi:alkylated DNA repair dioxygenase AlkB